MKRTTTVDRVTQADARLERIKHLVEQLAPAPTNSRQRRKLSVALRIEADAYRKSLDTEQATAVHGTKPQPTAGLGFLNRTSASRKPTLASRRRAQAADAPRFSVEYKTMPLLVVTYIAPQHGRVSAVAQHCSHLGRVLFDCMLKDGRHRLPLARSEFALRDGHVINGRSTHMQHRRTVGPDG